MERGAGVKGAKRKTRTPALTYDAVGDDRAGRRMKVMEKARTFEDLWVWQEARASAKSVYKDFGPGTPGERDYGFRNQIQAAAVSVMNNPAEGFERTSDAEFARYCDIAKGSCGEVRSMYYLAEDLGYVSPATAEERRNRARQISAGLASLIRHLRKDR